MALMTATFGVIVLAESSVEPRSLSSSVGFKPHTVVLTPVLQESNGQFTYLNSLKRTGTKELNTGSSGDSFIFMGADRELMEQIHASIDGTDAKLYGWYMEVTGYVNCKGSAYTKYTPNNLVHGWEGGTTTQKNIEYDANRNVKIVSQVCPLPEKANTTYTIVFAGKFNYFEGTGYANPDSRNFRVSTIFWPWEN